MGGECDHEMWDPASEVRRMRHRDVGFSLESFAVKSVPFISKSHITRYMFLVSTRPKMFGGRGGGETIIILWSPSLSHSSPTIIIESFCTINSYTRRATITKKPHSLNENPT